MDFIALHYQDKPLLIANVWDACSAIAAQQTGYLALGTSSAAIAAALGYEDGEAIPFETLLVMIRRIKSVTELPLSVDIEAGYGDSVEDIAANLKRLADIGVAGINLEDSKMVNGVRTLEDAVLFADKLQALRHKMTVDANPLFINIRTDTFLLGVEDTLQATLYRGHLYKQSGADGLFVPCITDEKEIRVLASEIDLPLNVMCMPALPDFDTLKRLGVRRISMGNFIHSQLQQQLKSIMALIQFQQSFAGVFRDESH